jgi:hypothetical protein
MRRRGVRGQVWYFERLMVEKLKQILVGSVGSVVALAEEGSAERVRR